MANIGQMAVAAATAAEEWAENQKKKKKSKKLEALLKELSEAFQKVKPKIDAVFEQGRLEGFADKEIGEWVREAMRGKYVERTMERVLPETAKRKYNYHKRKKKQNESNITSDITSVNSDKMSESEHENEDSEIQPIYEMPPEQYRSEDLEQYDKPYLCKIIRYLEKKLGV